RQDDGSVNFTRQMAALYVPDGAERILEFHYTDIDKSYQILLTAQGAKVVTDGFGAYTTKIETPYSVWRSISRGEISGEEALFQKQYSVSGDFSLMLKWDELFGGNDAAYASENQQSDKKTHRKTNMSVLLFPWIAIWVFMAINARLGDAAGIIAAASVPLLMGIFTSWFQKWYPPQWAKT
ncbi:MAG: SCP2 sterol-binding domain-containing protein, partial [Oscillospiraceae bacterium]|nr:SCP2 sterol-binding domain-containing protein [Oscillospiraceae bacterium]